MSIEFAPVDVPKRSRYVTPNPFQAAVDTLVVGGKALAAVITLDPEVPAAKQVSKIVRDLDSAGKVKGVTVRKEYVLKDGVVSLSIWAAKRK